MAAVPRQRIVAIAVVVNDQRDERGDEEDQHRDQEAHEDAMVVKPDAIIDPWTVMVEPLDTLVADTAVAGSVGANDLAIGA